MSTPSITTGKKVLGDALPLSASQATSPWNIMAYATKLRGRGAGVELTAADFASCVSNFAAWGKEIPVVLYHADTDAGAHPHSRMAHAWIVEMRVGTMTRKGQTVSTLEARFRWVNEATRAAVDSGELQFGSITLVQGGVDEETGADVGSFLWSFSLTNNPALVDLPRIAAERGATTSALGTDPEPHNDSADPQSTAGGSRAASENRMSNLYVALAARLGIAATSEEDAGRHIAARAEETAEVRRQLGLSMTDDGKAVAAKITALHADAAKVAVLSAENEALRAVETERREREVTEHLEALCQDPALAKSRKALENFARSDFAAFAAEYPRPVLAAGLNALTTRVTGLSREKTPASPNAPATSHSDKAHTLALEIQSKTPMTYKQALSQASKQIMAEVQS